MNGKESNLRLWGMVVVVVGVAALFLWHWSSTASMQKGAGISAGRQLQRSLIYLAA